jgi:hypothetical protein
MIASEFGTSGGSGTASSVLIRGINGAFLRELFFQKKNQNRGLMIGSGHWQGQAW